MIKLLIISRHCKAWGGKWAKRKMLTPQEKQKLTVCHNKDSNGLKSPDMHFTLT
jgi:hypothetical protein